jgi:hypothetical protein
MFQVLAGLSPNRFPRESHSVLWAPPSDKFYHPARRCLTQGIEQEVRVKFCKYFSSFLIGFRDLKRRICKFREQSNKILIDSKSKEFNSWVEQQLKIKYLVIKSDDFFI